MNNNDKKIYILIREKIKDPYLTQYIISLKKDIEKKENLEYHINKYNYMIKPYLNYKIQDRKKYSLIFDEKTYHIENDIDNKFFIDNNIVIDKVLSSEWCRCKQTAEYAFNNNYKSKSFLNSFFSQEFYHKKDKQIKELKESIKKWNGKNNLILVTHYVVILEILNLSVTSGEIIVTDKDFNILVRKNTKNN